MACNCQCYVDIEHRSDAQVLRLRSEGTVVDCVRQMGFMADTAGEIHDHFYIHVRVGHGVQPGVGASCMRRSEGRMPKNEGYQSRTSMAEGGG